MLNEIYRRRNDLAITGGAIAAIHGLAGDPLERFYGYGRHNIKPGLYFATEKKIRKMPPILGKRKSSGPLVPRKKPATIAPSGFYGKRKVVDNQQSVSGSSSVKKQKMPVKVAGSKRYIRSQAAIRRRFKKKGAKAGKKARRVRGKRSYKVKGRRGKRSAEGRYLKDGYVISCETGGLIKGDQCVYLGHGTSPGDRLLKTLCYSLIKALFTKAGIHIRDMSQQIGIGGTTSATKFNIYLTTEHQVTGVTADSAIGFDNTSTFGAIGDVLYNNIRAYITDTSTDHTKFAELSLRTDPGVVGPIHRSSSINLKNCFVDYKVVSSMKYQNRSFTLDAGETQAGPNENSQNVDRIPLFGKKYYGKGSAFEYAGSLAAAGTGGLIATANTPFAIDDTTGVLLKTAQNSDGRLKEPPHHKVFKGVRKSTGVVCQPGAVMVDVIKKSIKLPFSKILWMLNPNVTANSGFYSTQYTWNARYGVVSMVALEKALHATTDLVQVNFEVNQKHMCIIKDYKQSITVADYAQGGTAGIVTTLPTA